MCFHHFTNPFEDGYGPLFTFILIPFTNVHNYMCCTTLVEINLKMLLIEEDFLMLLMGFCYFIIISSRRGEMLELNQLVSFTSDSPSQDFA